jgi:hypothetical protein
MTDRRTSGNIGSDPYGFALGLRGGYTLDFKLYLGLYFSYYVGTSSEGYSANTTVKNTASASSIHFGAEVGYDWWLGPAVIRPSLELGPALALTTLSGKTTTINSMMFGPGLTIFAPIDSFFIGGDVHFNLLTGDGPGAILLAATAGVRF